MYVYQNGNIKFEYSVRRSKKAKRGRVIVDKGKVEVVLPMRSAMHNAQRIVSHNRTWIEKKLRESVARFDKLPFPHKIEDGAVIQYLGQDYNIKIRYEDEIIPQVVIAENTLNIIIPNHVPAIRRPETIRKTLLSWLKKQAQDFSTYYSQLYSERHGLKPKKIKVKTQLHRWGSCGPDNSINMNWQLIFYPREVFEYVIVHELCHIKHKDHSSRFWNLVEEFLPDYKPRYRWLKKNAIILDHI